VKPLLVRSVAILQVSKKNTKSGESEKNQLLNSGDFLSGEKLKKQEISAKIRRFGNPGNASTACPSVTESRFFTLSVQYI
jgi:hypothetical protein